MQWKRGKLFSTFFVIFIIHIKYILIHFCVDTNLLINRR